MPSRKASGHQPILLPSTLFPFAHKGKSHPALVNILCNDALQAPGHADKNAKAKILHISLFFPTFSVNFRVT